VGRKERGRKGRKGGRKKEGGRNEGKKTQSVSRTVSEIFSLKWFDLEIWVRGHSR